MKLCFAIVLSVAACAPDRSDPLGTREAWRVSRAHDRGNRSIRAAGLRRSPKLVHLACVTLAPILALADEQLLRRVRDGDLGALEALYRAYAGTVYTLGRRLCGSDEAADDILQETFLEISRSLGTYRGEGSLAGWVKKVCISKALMKLRRTLRLAEDPVDEMEESLPPGVALDAMPARLDLEHALASLHSTTRVVVWLHDVEGYTHEEIADLLEMSVSFSKSQLSRAHARLRSLLSEEPPSCGT